MFSEPAISCSFIVSTFPYPREAFADLSSGLVAGADFGSPDPEKVIPCGSTLVQRPDGAQGGHVEKAIIDADNHLMERPAGFGEFADRALRRELEPFGLPGAGSAGCHGVDLRGLD
jgi:hypothetical protein